MEGEGATPGDKDYQHTTLFPCHVSCCVKFSVCGVPGASSSASRVGLEDFDSSASVGRGVARAAAGV